MKRKLTFTALEIKEKGGLTFDETLAASELAEDSAQWEAAFGEIVLPEPCKVHLEFSVGGERFLLEGAVSGSWKAVCSRCLSQHAVPFQGNIEETYPASQETIDVNEDVRQALILSLPDKPLCKPSCLGLCARCGKDLNQGPCGCAPEKGPKATIIRRSRAQS